MQFNFKFQCSRSFGLVLHQSFNTLSSILHKLFENNLHFIFIWIPRMESSNSQYIDISNNKKDMKSPPCVYLTSNNLLGDTTVLCVCEYFFCVCHSMQIFIYLTTDVTELLDCILFSSMMCNIAVGNRKRITALDSKKYIIKSGLSQWIKYK
jgi:hypothetical protein